MSRHTTRARSGSDRTSLYDDITTLSSPGHIPYWLTKIFSIG